MFRKNLLNLSYHMNLTMECMVDICIGYNRLCKEKINLNLISIYSLNNIHPPGGAVGTMFTGGIVGREHHGLFAPFKQQ